MEGGRMREVGAVPEGWEVVSLSQVFKLASGISRPKEISETQTEKMPYPIYGGNGILGYTNKFVIDKETIVIGRVGEYCGSIHRASEFSWITDNALYAVDMPLQNINLDFLIQELTFINLNKFKRKSGQPLMTQTIINSIKIPLPPLPEQRRIAEVLSTVDRAIQKVGGAIAGTERLKKGLMQRLLTKGIGHERFKETEVGRVPEEWEVVRLGDAVEINRESRDPTREVPDVKFLYIDIESVEGGTGIIKTTKEILGKDAPSRARRVVHQNDVVMSTVRPYLKAFALVPKDYNNQICSTGFAVLSCKNEILPHYLLYTLFSKTAIDQCNKMMMGGQYPALNQSQVAKIEIPLPPLPEQRCIAGILSAADRKLELERRRKEKLERVKKGLMTELLTGWKRVKAE